MYEFQQFVHMHRLSMEVLVLVFTMTCCSRIMLVKHFVVHDMFDWQPLGPVRLTKLRVGLRQVAQDTYNGTAN